MAVQFPSAVDDITKATTGDPVVLARPANTADGDLLVAIVMTRSDTAGLPGDITGWTKIVPSVDPTNGNYAVYWLPVPTASALPASWSCSVGTTRGQGAVFRVTGADLAAPIAQIGTAVAGGSDGPSSLPLVLSGLTSTAGFMAMLGTFWTDTAPPASVIADMTQHTTNTTPATGVGRSSMGVWVSAATGAIADKTTDNSTWNPSGVYGLMIAFAEAAVARSGKVKYWNGSSWSSHPVKYWDGSQWLERPMKGWDGSSWILGK